MEEVKTRCKTKPQVYIPKNEKRSIVKQANVTTRYVFLGQKKLSTLCKDGTMLVILVA